MPPFEIALPVGAIAFYLYDCGMLLFDNELLFVRYGGRWRVTAGSTVVVLGRRLCLPAPLVPWALLFRASWSENDSRDGADAAWPPPALTPALRPLMFICGVLLLLLLLVVPIVSLGFGAGLALLAVFALYYLLLLAALIIVYARRRLLGLGGKAYWLLAIDVLACAPFAVNLVRKISLRQEFPGRPLDFCKSHLDGSQQQRVVAIVISRVDEFLASEDPESPQALGLRSFRTRLLGEVA